MPLKGADGFLQISIRLLICLPLPFLFLEKAMKIFRERLDEFLYACYTNRRYKNRIILFTAGIVQLVEHLLAKEKVTGSRPVARSSFIWRRGQAG